MKHIDPQLEIVLSSAQIIPAKLLRIEVEGVVLRYTSWGTSLIFEEDLGSALYLSRGFKVNAVPSSTTNVVDNVTIEIDDTDRGLYATLSGSAIKEFSVDLIYAVLTTNYTLLSSIKVFTGFLSQWDYVPGVCRLVASSIFVQWARVTTKKIVGSCRWNIFKGIECKYAGSQTACDRTYTTCSNYGNNLNYGGFRWLPSMVNKKIEV